MLIHDSYIEGAQMYGPRQRADIYRAIIEYGYYGVEPDWLEGEPLGFFIAIRPTIDTQKARSEAGRKSGESRRAKAEQKLNKSRTKAEQTNEQNDEQNDEQNAKESESESEVKKDTLAGVQRSRGFSKPSAEEVAAYASERGCTAFDAERFVDHYESNGWKVGKAQMKDWKAAVRNWIRNDGRSRPKGVREVGDERYSEYDR